jgi:cytidine deaminase
MAHKIEIVNSVDVLDTARELSGEESLLLARAQEATRKAYAPYSGFLVGAAVLLEDGSIYTGNNQENAAYPSGLCAERTALFGLRANDPETRIRMIAVTARRQGTESYVSAMSCGGCRQVMAEYENRQQAPITVLMQAGPDQVYRCPSVATLLPLQFTKDHLTD